MKFRVTTDKAQTLLKVIFNFEGSKKRPILVDAVNSEFETMTKAALNEIKSRTPGQGRVRENWRAEIVSNRFFNTWRIYNQLTEEKDPIISYLEHGTRPHIIKPKNKKALRFMVGSTKVFTKRVNHPGTKAYKMVASGRKVLERRLKNLPKKVEKIVKNKMKVK